MMQSNRVGLRLWLWYGHARRAMCVMAMAVTLAAATSSARAALTFNFNPAPGMSAQAIAGFQAAADLWSAALTDSVMINIDIDFTSLPSGVLAQAGSESEVFSYADVRTALIADATSADDAVAVANLSAGSALAFRTQDRAGTVHLDNETSGPNSVNNRSLDINTANAKAMGLIVSNPSASDASIKFSSNFTWDFDRSDGITAGTFDFVGIAAHEIGHALGFVSGVDIVDSVSGNGPNSGADLNGVQGGLGELDAFAIYSTLDLFRYSSASLLLGADVLDGAYGGTSFLSIDGGTTNLGLFSTGAFNGDGRQASHFKDNLGLGIMDPTAAPGELLSITTLDVRAFDVIGWDLLGVAATSVPAPGALAGGSVLLACCGAFTRRMGRPGGRGRASC